jgi:hypothetical protein
MFPIVVGDCIIYANFLSEPYWLSSNEQLLDQLRGVTIDDYQNQRKQQAQAEAPRKFLARLHRDPAKTMQNLADKYIAHLPLGSDLSLLFATPVLENLPQYTT